MGILGEVPPCLPPSVIGSAFPTTMGAVSASWALAADAAVCQSVSLADCQCKVPEEESTKEGAEGSKRSVDTGWGTTDVAT